ncbi:MAG: dynamin family protein, partial [Sulfurimicrobium sp.]
MIHCDAPEEAMCLGELRQCLADAEGLSGIPPGELRALQARVQSSVFRLVVVGEFKRGKSSVLNALIGADILPVGVVPLTAIATLLEYGAEPAVRVVFLDGSERQVPLETLWDFVTEKGNPANEKGVSEVHIAWPSAWLKSGVRLVDTPGIGSIYRHNTDVTYRFLPKADAVLFLLSVDQPVGQAEQDFLKEVREYAGQIFFLLNKTDLLSEADLAESVAFTSRVLAEIMGGAVPVFPVSARLALEGRKSGAKGLLEKSR